MHYQTDRGDPDGQTVRRIRGTIYDVAVDPRISSENFGRWFGITVLSSAPALVEFWAPEGFAHSFLTISAESDVEYLFTGWYGPAVERAVHWGVTTFCR